MEKPYYKSQLRLQKKKSTKHELIYKYTHSDIIVTIIVFKETPNLNRLEFKLNLAEGVLFFPGDTDMKKIILLNINRIIKSEDKGKCWFIKPKITNPNLLKLNIFYCILLQCGFVLQYTKELGYHFIR